MSIAGIDAVFIIIVAVSSLRCAVRGFISEFLSMAALILGIILAILFYRGGAILIRGRFIPHTKVLPEVIAFIVIFIVVYLVIKIVELTLKNIIEGIQLGSLDHLLGFILGFVEGLVVVCLFLFIIHIQPFFDSRRILDNSIIAGIFLPFIVGEKKEIMDSVVRLEIYRSLINGV